MSRRLGGILGGGDEGAVGGAAERRGWERTKGRTIVVESETVRCSTKKCICRVKS